MTTLEKLRGLHREAQHFVHYGRSWAIVLGLLETLIADREAKAVESAMVPTCAEHSGPLQVGCAQCCDDLRLERDAAVARAEMSGKGRDEAQAMISDIRAVLGSPSGPLETTLQAAERVVRERDAAQVKLAEAERERDEARAGVAKLDEISKAQAFARGFEAGRDAAATWLKAHADQCATIASQRGMRGEYDSAQAAHREGMAHRTGMHRVSELTPPAAPKDGGA